MKALIGTNIEAEQGEENPKPGWQEALVASEARYRRLFESAKDGILVLDAETGMILDVNPFLVDLLGYPADQFIHKEIWEIGFFKDVTANKEKFVELQQKQYIRYDNLPLETADGLTIYVEFISNVYLVDKKKVIQCNIRDITMRLQAEAALSVSENRYRRLFESSKDGILILDAESGMILDVNPFLIDLLGYPHEQFIEKEIWEIGFFRDIAANHDKFIELQQKQYVRYEDLPLETAEGRKINVEFVSNVYAEETHAVIQCNIRDITSRKQAEAELKHKSEQLVRMGAEKDKFFSIIAHDLRSPFNGFLGMTRLMAEDLPSMTLVEIQNIALTLQKSATNLYSLLENLLEWSMMQRGMVLFNPELIPLLPVINDAFALITEPAKTKGIKLSCDIAANIEVFAVNHMLESVIRNLISNAVKFTERGGSVTVTAKPIVGNRIEVMVKDTGMGMSADTIKNLFRLDINTGRTGTEGEASSGLGLFLCRDFVEKHGGTLKVESIEGEGSKFHFALQAQNL